MGELARWGVGARIAFCPETRPNCNQRTYERPVESPRSAPTPDFLPLQLLLATFAGWVNRHQTKVIEYLVEENRVLKEQLGGKRLRLTDAQRRRLAAKGKALGRKLLTSIATIVTPDTILRSHRRLIAQKWTHATPRTGRPGLMNRFEPRERPGSEWVLSLVGANPSDASSHLE